MNSFTKTSSSVGQFRRAHIVSADTTEGVICTFGDSSEALVFDVLDNGLGMRLALSAGDEVMVWQPSVGNARGVIMGRIADSQKPMREEIVIEAGRELILKCGKASIELFRDGTISIKGTDVVSRARRMNRIKGCSVTLN